MVAQFCWEKNIASQLKGLRFHWGIEGGGTGRGGGFLKFGRSEVRSIRASEAAQRKEKNRRSKGYVVCVVQLDFQSSSFTVGIGVRLFRFKTRGLQKDFIYFTYNRGTFRAEKKTMYFTYFTRPRKRQSFVKNYPKRAREKDMVFYIFYRKKEKDIFYVKIHLADR